MDSDTFKSDTIYKILKKEYELLAVQGGGYIGFIASKDLGIKCLDINILIENRRIVDEYKITDEKKWALSKIKYGF
jgi:hypothetical protein